MNELYWEKVVGDNKLRLNLKKLKESAEKCFLSKSDNYKQKLVYSLLEHIKNNDKKMFFYTLIKTINNPNENFNELIIELEKNYDVFPDEVFINFGYSIILGIMATYARGEKNE